MTLVRGDHAGMAPIERRSPVIGCRLPHRLLRALDEFVAHYHGERNHQGLGNELIMPKTRPLRSTRVRCRERLGGLLRYYHRAA